MSEDVVGLPTKTFGRNILADVIVLLIYSTLTNTNLDLLGAGSTGTAFL